MLWGGQLRKYLGGLEDNLKVGNKGTVTAHFYLDLQFKDEINNDFRVIS
jgi:hypothetical protein